MGEDNPTFEGLFEFCSISAGGSIGASIVRLRSESRLIYIKQARRNE
jgi:hypothetical protein